MEAEPDVPACPGCARRDRRIAALEARLEGLERKVRELAGAAKRQAAPFSKGPPKADPKPPGRKGGADYGGTASRRSIPPRIDKVYQAPLPQRCPHCGCSSLRHTGTTCQYQVELPREPVYRRFDVATGRCTACERTCRGRHPLQTSDATGACASQLGPDAQAALVLLNKELGLSHGKVSRCFNALFGIDLSPGGVCHALLRAARKGHVVYDAAIDRLRRQEQLSIDDTGWKVGGHAASLHAAAGSAVTAYLVHPRRNWQAIAKLLGGVTYDKTLVHDGYRAYDFFAHCRHQSCLAHLLVRCKRMLLVAKGYPRRFPRAVRALLKEALGLRDAQRGGVFTIRETAFESLDLQRRMAALVRGHKKDPENRRLARHLTRLLQTDQLFLFLREADTDATNHKAEQAIRPAVVNRKVWGGNRTWNGATAQSVLMSILRTAAQRGHDVLQTVSRILCEARPHRRAALLFPDSS